MGSGPRALGGRGRLEAPRRRVRGGSRPGPQRSRRFSDAAEAPASLSSRSPGGKGAPRNRRVLYRRHSCGLRRPGPGTAGRACRLVVSGINQGSNLGEDVLISGTVGAALQGYVRGCPSIAISVGALRDTRYDVAAAFLDVVVEGLKNGASLPPTLVNVNLPNEPVENLKGSG